MHARYRRKLLSSLAALSLGAPPSWGGDNTYMGNDEGTGGGHNSFFGYQAGKATTGTENTFIGYHAGNKNTSATGNTFFGHSAGIENAGSGSSRNTYFGWQAGRLVNPASGMLCVGWRSCNNSNTQNTNTFIGAQAGDNSNNTNSNTALGSYAQADAQYAVQATALGSRAKSGYGATSETATEFNTVIGWNAQASGDHNVIVGNGSSDPGTQSNLGFRNVMVGNNPALNMSSSTSGQDNVMLGLRAGEKLKEGNRNTFIGNRAGNNITYGYHNVIIGHEAQSAGDRSFAVSNYAGAPRLIHGDFYHGMITFRQLIVTDGGDMVESFRSEEKPEPGMVVSLDPGKEGKLRVAREAYDTRVAGIVSGAGGIKAGFRLRKRDTHLDGDVDLALRGRVYCRADAAYGAIRPGDLMTTSDTPGHAMKAADYQRGRGAFVGKAMSSLENGKGLVLVLVRD